MKRFLFRLAPLLVLLLTACPYSASLLRSDAIADRILLDVAAATQTADGLVAAEVHKRADEVRGSEGYKVAIATGYDCPPAQATAAVAPVRVTGEDAALCYFREHTADLARLQGAVSAFRTAQPLAYQQLKSGVITARSATKAAVSGLLVLLQGMTEAKIAPGPLGIAASDICYRGSELYVDLRCDAMLARALRTLQGVQ